MKPQSDPEVDQGNLDWTGPDPVLSHPVSLREREGEGERNRVNEINFFGSS